MKFSVVRTTYPEQAKTVMQLDYSASISERTQGEIGFTECRNIGFQGKFIDSRYVIKYKYTSIVLESVRIY